MKPPILIVLAALLVAQFACIPPQDCWKIAFHLTGTVLDETGNPFAEANIQIYNNGSFELPPFDVQLVTDARGEFTTETVSSFACTPFYVEITASDYNNQLHTFYPATGEGVNEYPPNPIFRLKAECCHHRES